MTISNRPELYHETVDVLYQAYFNDELKHGNQCGCAVGNICVKASRSTGINNGAWAALFYTSTIPKPVQKMALKRGTHFINEYSLKEAKELIEATGYTIKELARIELAFESAPQGESREDYMFNGLIAVLAVLEQIHGVSNDEVTLPRFQSHYSSLIA
jgi:hypothetical protein